VDNADVAAGTALTDAVDAESEYPEDFGDEVATDSVSETIGDAEPAAMETVTAVGADGDAGGGHSSIRCCIYLRTRVLVARRVQWRPQLP
jgi:hypothetical protein